MTRWFVQIDVRFRSVWPLSVEEAVADRLDRAGLLFDRENGVQGDPGPMLSAHLVIQAADAEEAAASGWELYRDALDAAGAEAYAHERTATVPIAEVERDTADVDAGVRRAGTLAAPQASVRRVLRDDLRVAEPSEPAG